MSSVGAVAVETAEDALRDLLRNRLDPPYWTATCILGDRDLAADAVQEAAKRAWASRRSLREPASVDAWFARIVVNVCRAEMSRLSKRPLIRDLEPVDGPASSLAQRDQMDRALSQLEARERTAIALRFGRDLTVPEISRITGMRQGTVKSRLHHALQHLRAALDADERAEETPR